MDSAGLPNWASRRGSPLSATLLAVALVLTLHAPSAAAEPSAPTLDALSLGGAKSPVLEELDEQPGVRVDEVGAGAGENARGFDMLILDGDELTAPAISDAPQIENFIAAGGWVLVVDVSDNDQTALSRHIGLNLGDSASGDRSEMMLFSMGNVDGTPQVDVVNSGPLPNEDDASGARLERLRSFAIQRIAAVAVERITSSASAEAAGRQARNFQRISCSPLNPPPDPELQHIGWCYTEMGAAAPPPGFWTKGEKRGWMEPYGAPGQQTVSWTVNHRFDVYLNSDAARPSGAFQTITYDVNGQVTPKRPSEDFFRMYEKFNSGWVPEQILERAWWTGRVRVAVAPDAATDRKLIWEASNPQSPNTETSYTSGNEFSIGFTGTGARPDGGLGVGINLGYSASNSKSHTIPDWGVENISAETTLRWLFSARHPCDARADVSHALCFDKRLSSAGGTQTFPALPNALSLGNFQFNASARWRTRQLLTSRDGKLTFAIGTPVLLIDTYCDGAFAGWCKGEPFFTSGCTTSSQCKFKTAFIDPGLHSVEIQSDWVDPIPIKAVTLPASANGSTSEVVTGKVILERAANVPVNISIVSNSANADVGAPIPGVRGPSRRTITINPGQTTADFRVATNDNDLTKGGHTTASITAFYTEPASARLRVEAR